MSSMILIKLKPKPLDIFFKAIYYSKSVNTPTNTTFMELVPKLVKRKDNSDLMQRIMLFELKTVMEGMEEDKEPCPDGFNARFIKVCWEIVHKDIFKIVLKAQQCERIGGSTNSEFLALIPKRKIRCDF